MMSRNGSIPATPVGRAKGARKAMKVNAQSFWPDGKKPSAAQYGINFHGGLAGARGFRGHDRVRELDTWKRPLARAHTRPSLLESLIHRIAYRRGSVKEQAGLERNTGAVFLVSWEPNL